MRDYYLQHSQLPRELYRQVEWLVRDYERLKTEYNNAIWNSPPPPDGQPHGDNTTDLTSKEAIKRAELFKKLEAIEQSKLHIPEEYREGVWNNILYKVPYPKNADRTTYWRHKSTFLRSVAEKMFWI